MKLILAVVSVVLSTTVAASAPTLRAVSITEDTPAPGASAFLYDLCTEMELAPFSASIVAESNECAAKTTYVWNSVLLPSTTERIALCTCTKLIGKLKKVKVPHCAFYRSDQLVSFAQLLEYAFGLCESGSSTSSATITPTATSTPIATTTNPAFTYTPFTFSPFTYSPIATDSPSYDLDTTTSSSKKSKSNVGLIIGIVAGVAAILGITGFVVFKNKSNDGNSDSDSEAGEVLASEDLSPLGGGAMASPIAAYIGAVSTPASSSAKQVA